jgi:hypothetical protein
MCTFFSILNKTKNYVLHQNADKKIGSFLSYTEKEEPNHFNTCNSENNIIL